MRAIISPSGSFKAIDRSSLPARLDQTRDQALGAEIPQRDTRQLELAVVSARTPGHLPAIPDARRGGIARRLGKLQRSREALFHRLRLVVRDLVEPRAPARKFLGH